MRAAKKVSALLMAVMMVMAIVTVSAFADGEDGGTAAITLTPQDNTGRSYSAYQIFTGTLSNSGVLSDVDWADGANGTAILAALKAASDTNLTDTEGSSLFANCQNAAQVAEVITNFGDNSDEAKALASLFAENIGSLGTAQALTGTSAEGYPQAEVPVGYYLVVETTADGENTTDPILHVTNGDYITAKADGVPTVTKEADGISYGIGDEIPYTVTVALKDYTEDADAYSFTLTDNFGANLKPAFTTQANPSSIQDGLKIYLGKGEDAQEITAYFYLAYNTAENTMTVTAHHPDDGSNNLVGITGLDLSSDSVIVLKYKAVVVNGYDGGAVVNKVQYKTSVTVPEYVYPINIQVNKVGTDGTTPLDGAQFKLYRGNEEDGFEYAQINADSGNVTAWTNDIGQAAVLETVNGTFTVSGLAAGTYSLKEVVAPTGYNLPDADFTLVVRATENTNGNGLAALTITVDNGTTQNGDVASNTVTATIQNNKGATLPSTGGMGTTIFYVIGGILVFGAVVLLVVRKRMREE